MVKCLWHTYCVSVSLDLKRVRYIVAILGTAGIAEVRLFCIFHEVDTLLLIHMYDYGLESIKCYSMVTIQIYSSSKQCYKLLLLIMESQLKISAASTVFAFVLNVFGMVEIIPGHWGRTRNASLY